MTVANCLTTGITLACADACCSGGLNRIWIAQRDDVASVTRGTEDEVTAITMVATKVFYEIQFLDFSAVLNESTTVENNNVSIDQTIEFTEPCWSDTLRQRLQELLNCCCGTVVIVEEMSGTTKIIGDPTNLRFGRVKMRGIEGTSGAALADPNQQVITLGTFAAKLIVEFTPGAAGVPV